MIRHTRTAVRCLSFVIALACATSVYAGPDDGDIVTDNVFAGAPAQIDVLFNLTQPILGFSFGVSHDAAVLTPTAVNQGAAVLATNAGTGADYFLTELAPANGPGLFVACVFSLSAPLDSLPVGVNQQAVVIDYATSPTAAPGSTSVLTAVNTLGSPPTSIVFTILNGTSVTPVITSGGVTFEVPEPTGTTCTLTDPCACDFNITWTNGAAYSAVEVRVDGVLTQTLPGASTSTTLNLGATGSSATVDVRGVIGTLSSIDDTCTANCPLITPAPIPSGFICSIATSDAILGCTVDVSWTLEGTYSALELLVDGVSVSVLPGTATTDTISLVVSATPQQICLQGTDQCGAPIAANACCNVTCFPGTLFVRGDCNVDSGFDIGDPIFILGVLFSGAGPAQCNDACDVNDDGQVDISDPIYSLGVLFSGGNPPPAPFPGCGIDGTDTDALDCQSFPAC